MGDTVIISSLAFFQAVIAPAFADVIPQGFPYRGTLNEFTLMDNVPTKRQIIDIRRTQNIMQRRDASCDIIYKKIIGATTRMISVEEIYGATKFCKNEFYQGALKDWRANDPLFGNKILPWFQQAVNTDLASNSYFGDVDRVAVDGAVWSTNVYDGVFKWINRYIDEEMIPASQTKDIANGKDWTATGGPSDADDLLASLYNSQPQLMKSYSDDQKAFYVSKEIRDAYVEYLIATGATMGNIAFLENGIKRVVKFRGIEVLVEEIWTPVITEIKGSAGYAAVLTLRGNFVFATDKNYGEGEDDKTALMVWYEKKDLTWYYQLFLKAGTQIALPEFVVVALSSWT